MPHWRPLFPMLLATSLLAACAEQAGPPQQVWNFALAALPANSATIAATAVSTATTAPASTLTGRALGWLGPLALATISVYALDGSGPSQTARADAQGAFSLTPLPAPFLLEADLGTTREIVLVSSTSAPLRVDPAGALALSSVRPRFDTLVSLGAGGTDWSNLEQEASALRSAIATLPASASAWPTELTRLTAGQLMTLCPNSSEVATSFIGAAALLGSAIRGDVLAGEPQPTGVGVGALVFGGAYAPPVFTNGGSASGGLASAPLAGPTAGPGPGVALSLSPVGGGFANPSASPTIRVGP